MFDGIAFFLSFIIGTLLILVGILTLAYGLVSLTVKKFDPGIRLFCFIIAAACLGAFAFIEYKRNVSENHRPPKPDRRRQQRS